MVFLAAPNILTLKRGQQAVFCYISSINKYCMKKLLITIVLIAAAAMSGSVGIYAQSRMFVGGQMSISSSSSYYHGGDKHSTTAFSIRPEFGRVMNDDRWILGVACGYSYGHMNGINDTGMDDEGSSGGPISDNNSIGLHPFAMFRVFKVSSAALWIDGDIGYDYACNKGSAPGGNNHQEAFVIGTRFRPVISWQVSDHFSFYSELGFLSLGYTYSDYLSNGVGRSNSSFSVGIDTYSFLDLSDISIGFRYWF